MQLQNYASKSVELFDRMTLRPEVLAFMVSVLLLGIYNFPLWQHLSSIVPSNASGLVMRTAFGAMVLAIFNLVLISLSFRWVFKPILVALLISSSAVAYFMSQYGVLVDKNMLRNVAETDVGEVRDLLSLKLFLFVFFLGALPSWLLWRLPVKHRPIHRELFVKGALVLGCIAALGLVALGNYQGLASLFRNHHELKMLVVPSNYLGASYGYLREELALNKQQLRQIGTDAHKAAAWKTHKRTSLTVLVIGESARADNFGVLGYARETTPRLSKEDDLLTFRNVRSCGTETSVSVPCMFSNMGRAGYDATQARSQEGLLDLLKRAGLIVAWHDNQSGCKGTCDRVTYEQLSHLKDPEFCADGECHDEILLKGLQGYIDNLKEDTVLVLHQMGSHGPDYFKRYPKEFETFTPVCTSNALNDCSRESITNAYDNTLVYTDYVLSSLIDLLRKNQDKADTAMLYLSDHGESLGEYSLFLHGTPFVLAPDQQKHVAMLAWFSDGYKQDFAVTSNCLASERDKPLSQDNLFHSMLGLLQVQTHEYNASLDIFAPCRAAES